MIRPRSYDSLIVALNELRMRFSQASTEIVTTAMSTEVGQEEARRYTAELEETSLLLLQFGSRVEIMDKTFTHNNFQ